MKQQFLVEVDLEGAAFADAEGAELARILRGLADRVEESGWPLQDGGGTVLLDYNGNRVGSAVVR